MTTAAELTRQADRTCVIGAGPSGITACKSLQGRGIEFDCFEKGSEAGGVWRYRNDNQMSSAYRSLHINTSREQMQYAAFPMPDDYPDYAGHELLAQYFDAYVDHFGFRDSISFRTEVLSVEPGDDHTWQVTTQDRDGERETHAYASVIVANGHHWDPRMPEPSFPGSGEFEGEQIHAHHYRETDILEDKRVLILGIGNSACDIAVESSRIADKTFLAMRRGAYIMPKYLRGRPTDELSGDLASRMPIWVQRKYLELELKNAVGTMTQYGLPEPDHKLLEAHPTVSSELLPRLGHGDITVKPNIDHLDGDSVVFVDGSSEKIDLIIYCTGYRITFPFLDPGVIDTEDNRVSLYRRTVPVDRPGLYFIGLIQPLGAIMPLAELQSEWVADLVDGSAVLPPRREMLDDIERDEQAMAKRYIASKRHTIQVDFHPYARQLRNERRIGIERAQSHLAAAH